MAELTPQQEAELAAYIAGMYATWLPAIEAAVLAGYIRFGIAPDPAAINTTAAVWRDQIAQLQAGQLTPLAAQAYAAEDPGQLPPPGDPLLTAAAAATLVFLMAQIPEIQADLVTIVATATGVAAAVTGIRAYLSSANAKWRSKSLQVAQTEGDRHVQAATLAAAFRMQRRDGLPREKTWVSRDDNRVRPTHEVADGQTRPIGVPFIVGGSEMMYPKDPSAPAQEVVNCRCGMRIRVMSRG